MSTDYRYERNTHITRAFMCQISLVKPTKDEAKALDEKNVALDVLRSYYVWRRSSLRLTMYPLLGGMISGLYDLYRQLNDSNTKAALNVFGRVLILIQNIGSTFLFIGVVFGFVWWNQFTKSIRAVRIAFLMSFIMPFIPALFPLEMTLNNEARDYYNDDATEGDLVSKKLAISMSYVLTLLPVIISFPGGVLRASLRIRWLLPESMLSGWILVIIAPFYSILICITLIVVLQMAGNFVLSIGTLFVVFAPWVYVIRGSLFVHLWTEEKKKQVLLAQRISGVLTIIGYVIIIVFAFTEDVYGVGFVGDVNSTDTVYLLSYAQAFRILFETIGRLLVTTLMFCDVILRMNLENWQEFETSKLTDEVEIKERYEVFIKAFHDESDTAKDVKPIVMGVSVEAPRPKVYPSVYADCR